MQGHHKTAAALCTSTRNPLALLPNTQTCNPSCSAHSTGRSRCSAHYTNCLKEQHGSNPCNAHKQPFQSVDNTATHRLQGLPCLETPPAPLWACRIQHSITLRIHTHVRKPTRRPTFCSASSAVTCPPAPAPAPALAYSENRRPSHRKNVSSSRQCRHTRPEMPVSARHLHTHNKEAPATLVHGNSNSQCRVHTVHGRLESAWRLSSS